MEKRYKLLIIDDNEEILSLLTDFFMEKRYEVVSVSNGLDAFKLLDSSDERFDIIVTDIVMPDISGIGIISIAKNKFPDTPIIGITGWGEHPQALAQEVQADEVVQKPIDLQELQDTILRLITDKSR